MAELARSAPEHGIKQKDFAAIVSGLTPDREVARLARRQPESTRPIGAYLEQAVNAQRIKQGSAKAKEWRTTLDRIEARYGVPREVLLAIWGIETNFGSYTGGKDVVRSLATLAAVGYRGDFFRGELYAAAQILIDGEVSRQQMTGSWAGAMGNTQFIPSSFRRFAVDFDGDGKRDLWRSVPDSLASAANYLSSNDWRPGVPWGVQVRPPASFDYGRSRGSAREWRALGFTRVDGSPLPELENAILFYPAGAKGPAFLVSENYSVIKTYNNSDHYALAVIGLAERIGGREAYRGAWPKDPPLTREERIKLQKDLAALGYRMKAFDGRIDFDARDAIRELQAHFGFVPDGNPTLELLRSVDAMVTQE